jgi:Uma2 family endonuclease
MHAATFPRMTPDEFLAWDREQKEKHVYFHGEVFALFGGEISAMAGGTPRHARLGVRVASRLEAALGGKTCEVYSSDLRFGLDDAHFVYADAVVVCRPLQLRAGSKDVVTNPRVVVEVLSRSTELYDRGEKQAAYLALPSVQSFVLVSQHAPRVEVYTRESSGGFHYQAYGPGSVVKLAAIDAAIAVDDLYAGVFELPGDEDGREPQKE